MQLHSYLSSELNGVDSQRNNLATLNPRKRLDTDSTGSCMGQNAGQNECGEK